MGRKKKVPQTTAERHAEMLAKTKIAMRIVECLKANGFTQDEFNTVLEYVNSSEMWDFNETDLLEWEAEWAEDLAENEARNEYRKLSTGELT